MERGEIDVAVCELPAALALAARAPGALIIRCLLRPNPFRPLYGIATMENARGGAPRTNAGSHSDKSQDGDRATPQDARCQESQAIAVPKGTDFRYAAEKLMGSLEKDSGPLHIRECLNMANSWRLLAQGEVFAALLRTPFIELARARGATIVADDRDGGVSMSVVVAHRNTIEEKPEVIRRLMLGMEQSILALNLFPDRHRGLLAKKGEIPAEIVDRFPMPLFEGSSVPSPEELKPITIWLLSRSLPGGALDYTQIVHPAFLPDPEAIGLAPCCR